MANNITVNKFVKGVNTDIAEDLLPNSFLSGGHNIKFTNDDNKQGIVQKQESYIKELDGYGANLKPLAAEVFKDVIYIISYNSTGNYVEYGSYPSADLSGRYTNSEGKEVCPKDYVYAPLPNYNATEASTSLEYLSPFRIPDALLYGYDENSIVDMEIQPFYDGSVNIISTTTDASPRIINSRQKFLDTEIELIIRNSDNLDNVYSAESIEKSLLVPIIGDIVPKLIFIGVNPESGQLINGGYNYYFKLKTSDGVESAIIEESRLVSVHSGTTFGKATSYTDNTITRNAVQFNVTNLDTKIYRYISVYYTRSSGITEIPIKTAYHIDKDYKIEEISTGVWECSIVHTGFEPETLIDESDIIIEYSPIDSAATLTQKNNRLLLGNMKASSVTDTLLRTAALSCYVEETLQSPMFIEQPMFNGNTEYAPGLYTEDSYADPYNIYYKTAYFPGETYELAINFVFRNGLISDAYPIMGFDWENHGTTTFDLTKLGDETTGNADNGWYSNSGGPKVQNIHGVVRMKNLDIEDTVTPYIVADKTLAKMDVYTMSINTVTMVTDNNVALTALGVRSYFISRRKRIPDLLMEGLVTLAAAAPITSMYPTDITINTFGSFLGYGLDTTYANNAVLFPVPGNAMPFSSEALWLVGATTNGAQGTPFDGILYAPIASSSINSYFAFYSPDITSDTARAATISSKETYSLYTSSLLTQSIGYIDQNLVSVKFSASPAKYAHTANPYRFETPFINPGGEDGVVQRFQYVDDALRSFTSMGFTGKLDRQASLFLYMVLASYANKGYPVAPTHAQVITFEDQMIYAADQLLNSNDIYSTPRGFTNGDPKNYWATAFHTESEPQFQLMMTGVNYSPYIGLKLNTAISTRLTSNLNLAEGALDPRYFTAFSHDTNQIPPNSEDTKLGTVARLYSNGEATMMNVNDWISKYSITRAGSYFAISERFETAYPVSVGGGGPFAESFLKGGDCYAGFYYQRVWRPGGIDGIPTASNPANYLKDETDLVTREGVNITNSGYAIGFPVRSNYNFALRALHEVDEVETKLYGKSRTYTSSLPENEVHGNRQAETSVINYGNIIQDSILTSEQFDPTIPYIKLEYDNRIVTSEISITGEFENGYRNFKGLNFKDYDEDLGPITAVISHGLYSYIIFNNGVSLIEISERSAVTNETTGANVYTASADILPPKSIPVFTNIGSQHLKSIIPTEAGVFGVDADSKKIWAINVTEKKVISDTAIQALLNEIITPQIKDIISSYDVTFNEVTFTFIYEDDSQRSILFNSAYGYWYGTTDIHKLYQFNVEERMLSLQRPEETSVYNLYFPVVNTTSSDLFKEVGKTTAVDDRDALTKTVYNSYIEFIIKNEHLNKFDLSNIIINGTGVPSAIDIITDNIENYTLDIADSVVSGLEQYTVPVHTNIYMQDATSSLTWLDSYRFERIRNSNFKTLIIGDKITIDLEGSLQQFTIANITYDDINTDTIVLSNPMIGNTMTAIYYGWKIPVRISLGESMAGKTKITIPSKKHTDLLKGASETAQNYHVNYSNTKPYGRWVKLRLNFKGIEQIYIESIMSEISLRYS